MHEQELTNTIEHKENIRLEDLGEITYHVNEALLTTPIEEQIKPIIIQNIFYRYYLDHLIPFLEVRGSQHQPFVIPLIGRLDLKFGKRYCLNCHNEISLQERIPYCTSCMYNELYGLQCRFTGPGSPFQEKCTSTYQPCHNHGGPKSCFTKHYVYLASIGQFIKVGISSEKRKTNGRYARLMEQGVSQAITVHGFQSLHEAMTQEQILQQRLSIPDYITGAQKTLALTQNEIELATRTSTWYTTLKTLYPEHELKIFTIIENKPQFQYIQYLDPPPEHLYGDIIYSLGSLIIVQHHDNTMYSIDAKRLQGREIIPWEEP